MAQPLPDKNLSTAPEKLGPLSLKSMLKNKLRTWLMMLPDFYRDTLMVSIECI